MANFVAPAATQKDYAMHEVLLGGWGCPIGELFDLEALAEQCKKAGRYSFFVTSEVCNVSFRPGRVHTNCNVTDWGLGAGRCCEPAEHFGHLLSVYPRAMGSLYTIPGDMTLCAMSTGRQESLQ